LQYHIEPISHCEALGSAEDCAPAGVRPDVLHEAQYDRGQHQGDDQAAQEQ
jgi:hypothetical protein